MSLTVHTRIGIQWCVCVYMYHVHYYYSYFNFQGPSCQFVAGPSEQCSLVCVGVYFAQGYLGSEEPRSLRQSDRGSEAAGTRPSRRESLLINSGTSWWRATPTRPLRERNTFVLAEARLGTRSHPFGRLWFMCVQIRVLLWQESLISGLMSSYVGLMNSWQNSATPVA